MYPGPITNTRGLRGGGSSDTGSSGGGGGSPAIEKPVITTQPAANQSVVTGSSATFMVTATGGAPLAYQWKKNGADISGATSSTYTLPATSMGDRGTVFTVVVSNSAGTATSTEAKLTVTGTAEPPTITTQPADQTVITGTSASFSVSATGTSPLTYQWKKDGTDIPGATSSTYAIAATSIADSAVFTVVITNGAGTATSSNARLTVADALVAPAITKQPAAQTVTAGQTASFSVEATGTAPLRYQWKLNDQDISGATDSSYATSDTNTVGSAAVFTVVVSNGSGTATSDKATLTVTPAPVAPAISTQPVSQSVASGQTASFSVVATGTEPLAYQWKRNGIDIAGATSSTYKPVSSSELNGAKFSVVVTNSASTVTSNEAVLSDVAISVQPAAQPVVAPATASFSVTAAGTGTLTYQWKKNGSDIAGATSSTYTTPVTSLADSGTEYSVVVSNSLGTATSSNATLSVFTSRYALVPKAVGTYTKEECVKDNITGLIWEGKTASPVTSRLGTSTYTNYDSTSSAQKSDGTNPTQTEIDAITNSIGYRNSVRTLNLCGYNDWRLPTKEELEGILASSGSPRIDTDWFPNTRASIYWSSSPYVGYAYNAWYVSFFLGSVSGNFRYDVYYVRLVR